MSSAKVTRNQPHSTDTIKAFYSWAKEWKTLIRKHPETKKTPNLYMLADVLTEHFDWMNFDCFPSRETIAEEMGEITVRTVTNLTDKLTTMGFLEVRRRGRNNSNLYTGIMPDERNIISHHNNALKGNVALDDGKTNDIMKGNAFPTNITSEHNYNPEGPLKAPSEDISIFTSASEFKAPPSWHEATPGALTVDDFHLVPIEQMGYDGPDAQCEIIFEPNQALYDPAVPSIRNVASMDRAESRFNSLDAFHFEADQVCLIDDGIDPGDPIYEAEDDALIRCASTSAESNLEKYLSDLLDAETVKRLIKLYCVGKLTAGAVVDACAAAWGDCEYEAQ